MISDLEDRETPVLGKIRGHDGIADSDAVVPAGQHSQGASGLALQVRQGVATAQDSRDDLEILLFLDTPALSEAADFCLRPDERPLPRARAHDPVTAARPSGCARCSTQSCSIRSARSSRGRSSEGGQRSVKVADEVRRQFGPVDGRESDQDRRSLTRIMSYALEHADRERREPHIAKPVGHRIDRGLPVRGDRIAQVNAIAGVGVTRIREEVVQLAHPRSASIVMGSAIDVANWVLRARWEDVLDRPAVVPGPSGVIG